MLIVGPRSTVLPLAACSAPIIEPYSCSAEVSQVAATSTGAGSWVTLLIPSPTPAGPSSRFVAGMHSELIAGMFPTYLEPDAPVIRAISWLSDIWAISSLTRVGIAAVELTHGHAVAA